MEDLLADLATLQHPRGREVARYDRALGAVDGGPRRTPGLEDARRTPPHRRLLGGSMAGGPAPSGRFGTFGFNAFSAGTPARRASPGAGLSAARVLSAMSVLAVGMCVSGSDAWPDQPLSACLSQVNYRATVAHDHRLVCVAAGILRKARRPRNLVRARPASALFAARERQPPCGALCLAA